MDQHESDVKEKAPIIPEDTLREMAKFFMKTSIPRILEEKRKMAEKQIQK